MSAARKSCSRQQPPILRGAPAKLGYSFPAEWTRHAATWLSWPRPEGISFPERYHLIPPALARIVKAIAAHETVCINVPNENYRHIVQEQLRANGLSSALIKQRVRCFLIPTNECWCRDHGPAFVTRKNHAGKKEVAIIDWGYNAWGGKYPPFDADDAVPTRVAEALGDKIAGVFYPRRSGQPIVMEGGSVDFNGAGTVLTTESCLLNQNRNHHLTKRQIERVLCDYYGQQQVLWLGDGIVGDDTDGHIDDITRFIGKRTLVTAWESDPADENHQPLDENLRRLQLVRDPQGRSFEIIKLPMPKRVEVDGQRLPASYLNFYFCNAGVLVPTFRQTRRDRQTLEILQAALPKKRVIGIDCKDLIWGLGAIHCLSQQQPA